ncbi:MAG TPA: TetR/AcrR family transcriptional regulator [Caulobacteraceae bacterium]|nr:TetR/AcrR family transcriptional regulator [Caulobacteraceae bacterium]
MLKDALSPAQPPLAETRSEARRRAILEVAREAFLSQGYAGASMSEIAQRLGGSKGTLYNYFRSKEDLFVAFMNDVCQGPMNAILADLAEGGGALRGRLIEAGERLLGFLAQEKVQAIHRLVVAEIGRFPEVGRLFYENGPMRGDLRLADYFAREIAAGTLRGADPMTMARRFKMFVLGDVYQRRMWGVIAEPSAAQVRAQANEGVDLFLAIHAGKAGADA